MLCMLERVFDRVDKECTRLKNRGMWNVSRVRDCDGEGGKGLGGKRCL
jgi:hypothetical protein